MGDPVKALHRVKCHPVPFDAVCSGIKTAEFRYDDRGYQVGDDIELAEWHAGAEYTGRQCTVTVTHCQRGFGIPEGYVMLSVRLVSAHSTEERKR